MADKRTRRQEKKRAKDKARQKVIRKQANERRQSGKANAERAGEWDLGECWLSEGWDERGARAMALFARQDLLTNRVAAAIVEVDLGEEGVVSAAVRVDLQLATYQSLVGQISESHALQSVSGGQVVKLVEAAAFFGDSRGHDQPKGLADVRALFAGLAPSGEDPLLGNEAEDGETVRKSTGGFWANLKSRFGLG